MRPLFTELVRSLGEAPDRRLFAAAWVRLRALLRAELKRRGLWDSSPDYLGIYGWRHWEAPGANGTVRMAPDDALEELTAECFAFIFVTRIWSLKAQLKVKPNIEGLVLLDVRHFLYERQREHDPFGFRIFEMLHAVASEVIARGELFVLAGDARVRNDTLLAFDPAAEPDSAPQEIGGLVAQWNDDLMPALVTAKGAEQKVVLGRLLGHLLALEQHGIRSFRFRNVIDPLKYDARARWASLLETEGEDQDLRLRQVLPEAVFASRQSFEQLACGVSAAIDALEIEPRTKAHLSNLWEHLCRHAERDHAGLAADDEEVLSQRRLAQLLGLRRARLPELFGILRQLVTRCQDTGRPRLDRIVPPRRESPAPAPPSRFPALKGSNQVDIHDR